MKSQLIKKDGKLLAKYVPVAQKLRAILNETPRGHIEVKGLNEWHGNSPRHLSAHDGYRAYRDFLDFAGISYTKENDSTRKAFTRDYLRIDTKNRRQLRALLVWCESRF